jgi:DNA-3-methyladenine glycosylase I
LEHEKGVAGLRLASSAMTNDTGLYLGGDALARCKWCQGNAVYENYHDTEWGFPVGDEKRLFEKICLEGFQCGLSWLTILSKREAFRRSFANFDVEQVSRFGASEVTRMLADPSIVRHRGKIESTINNAKRLLELQGEHGSLSSYVWNFEPLRKTRPRRVTPATRGTTNDEATALSKDLKKRGWSFVGPTTVYAFMQAMGLVNDHFEGCDIRPRALQARVEFSVPVESA